MRRVLITGGAGFVAQSVIPAFKSDGWAVRIAVRAPPDVSQSEGVEANVLGDFVTARWEAALSGVDTVVHLAARAHRIGDSLASAKLYFEQNVGVTERLAEASAAARIRRFVFLSSVKATAEESESGQPLSEDTPCKPVDPYGVSKFQAERRLAAISSGTGLPVTVVRPPLVYGPGVRANFRKLLGLIKSGAPLPFSGITNLRSLIFTGNLASALVRCASHPAATNRTYFVSDGRDLSTSELLRLLSAAAGRPARQFRFPPKLMEVVFRSLGRKDQFDRLYGNLQVNIDRIRLELGWTPPYSLEFGLASLFRKSVDL